MNAQDAETIVAAKSEAELEAMLARPNDWQPLVLQAASAQLQKRGIGISSVATETHQTGAPAKAALGAKWDEWGKQQAKSPDDQQVDNYKADLERWKQVQTSKNPEFAEQLRQEMRCETEKKIKELKKHTIYFFVRIGVTIFGAYAALSFTTLDWHRVMWGGLCLYALLGVFTSFGNIIITALRVRELRRRLSS